MQRDIHILKKEFSERISRIFLEGGLAQKKPAEKLPENPPR